MSLPSVRCRLLDLIDATTSAVSPPLQDHLLRKLVDVRNLLATAGPGPHLRQVLSHARERLDKYIRGLKSRGALRRIDPTKLAALLGQALPIRDDLGALLAAARPGTSTTVQTTTSTTVSTTTTTIATLSCGTFFGACGSNGTCVFDCDGPIGSFVCVNFSSTSPIGCASSADCPPATPICGGNSSPCKPGGTNTICFAPPS